MGVATPEAGLARGRSLGVAGGTAGGGARAEPGAECDAGGGGARAGGGGARRLGRGPAGPVCARPSLRPADSAAGLRPGLTLGFSSDMVARRRWRQAQREPVALERASHALCPAALPPQLSRGRALSLNPGAPVGRAESRGRARARGACPAPRVRAGQPRLRTVANASRGGSGARVRAETRGRATQGPGTRDPGCGCKAARPRREQGRTGGLGALVLGQEPEERFGPTGSHFAIHV